MSRHSILWFSVTLWSVISFSTPAPVSASTPLTRAVIEALRNRVQLMPRNRPVRSASLADVMAPGDGLSTGQSSLAELRFNDGSFARLGEQVVFRFVPRTRTFHLSNGTVLLLVPPGQGRTRLQTPNVVTGIQGSALFVRHIAETNTTLVGALTDSGIEVTNLDGTQRQPLRAGQMAVIVEDRIEHLYNFDLNTFYSTSSLVQGLNLNLQAPAIDTAQPRGSSSDPAIAAVQAETMAAIAAQPLFPEEGVIENPSFVYLPETVETASGVQLENQFESQIDSFDGFEFELEEAGLSTVESPGEQINTLDIHDVRAVVEAGEMQATDPENNSGGDAGSPDDEFLGGGATGDEFPGGGATGGEFPGGGATGGEFPGGGATGGEFPGGGATGGEFPGGGATGGQFPGQGN